jgi:hypothetical protein
MLFWGFSKSKIAKELGKSFQHVQNVSTSKHKKPIEPVIVTDSPFVPHQTETKQIEYVIALPPSEVTEEVDLTKVTAEGDTPIEEGEDTIDQQQVA